MTKPSPRPRPISLETARADDALLDALGRGEPAPADDELAMLLAAWRAEVATDVEPAVRAPRRAWSGWRVRLVAAAALVSLALGGTSLAAANAGPDSPLWPVTQIINPDHADEASAQATLDQARRAIADGRRADARRLLDQAAGQIAKVRDPGAAARLRAELDALRSNLSSTVPVPVPGVSVPSLLPNGQPAPSVTPAPSAPGRSGGAGTPAPGGGNAGNGGGTGGGGILPSLPVPSLPSILPSLPPIL